MPASSVAPWPPPRLAGISAHLPADPGSEHAVEADVDRPAIWVLVVSAVAHVMLAGILWMTLWATLPRLVGWQPTVITGGSMSPLIEPGDIVVTRPARPADLGPGAVITYIDPLRPGALVTHRIIEITPAGRFRTRGDHNASDDTSLVSADAVQGRAVLRIPALGMPLIWMQQAAWLELAITVLLLASMTWAVARFPL